MNLSKEQKRKIQERLEWLIEDVEFRRRSDDVSISMALHVVETALTRFEEEKIAITGGGRYQAQCEELVSNADAFYGNYAQELKQLSLSWFRFAHRVLEDHLGDVGGLRALTLSKGTLIVALNTALSAIRLLVVDHKE